jgi:hypothetical protein
MSETVHLIEILLVEGNPDNVRMIEGREGRICLAAAWRYPPPCSSSHADSGKKRDACFRRPG